MGCLSNVTTVQLIHAYKALMDASARLLMCTDAIMASLKSSGQLSAQSIVEVLNQIVGSLQTYRQPHQSVADARFDAIRGRHSRV